MVNKKEFYRKTLEMIAEHFEGADIDGETPADESCQWVVRRVCFALGWEYGKDANGELILKKGR